MIKTKKFHLGDVLSVITGHLVSPRRIDGFFDIYNFMASGKSLWSAYNIFGAVNECKTHLLKQFPQLDTPEMQFAVRELVEILGTTSDEKEYEKHISEWLSKLTCGKYGFKIEEMLEVRQIP